MVGPLSRAPPNILMKKLVMIFKKNTTGVKRVQTKATNRAKNKAIVSAFLVAKDFGVISPKTKIKNVTTPVAAATRVAESPKIEITNDVDNDEAPILTKLFPTKIELNKRSELDNSFSTVSALLFPSSAKFRILILLTDKNAVSVQEKIPEKIINMTNIITLVIWVGSTINLFSLLLMFFIIIL